jgi:hypothetical protein
VHDIRRADARLLPAMAAMVAWRLKEFLDEEGQRTEIGFAAEVYRTVGTPAALADMVNRITGWAASSRDFVRNVLLTWDPTRIEQLAAGPAYLDGSAHLEGTPPALVTRPLPQGTVDTTDAAAMQRLRDRDRADLTAYTIDLGPYDAAAADYRPDDTTWYNRTSVGLYVKPPAPLPAATIAEVWGRTRALLAEFTPIQVRLIVFVEP